MRSTPPYLRAQADGAWLMVKIQPRAATSGIVGSFGNELRIRLAAAPVDNAANEALVRFLAERLDCPRRQIELVRGHTARHKVLRIRGLSKDEILDRLRH